MTPVLVLGGSPEADTLAGEIRDLPGGLPILSLPPGTLPKRFAPVQTRTGGFGGTEGLAEWLARHEPVAVVTATHPFANRIQDQAIEACERAGVPHLRLLRPPWPNRPNWFLMPDASAAARHLPPGARVFLLTGHADLDPFAARRDVVFALGTTGPVSNLPDNILPITARTSCTETDEQALLERLDITHVVTPNAGGAAPAKLAAAERLRLTTLMIARPRLPNTPIVETVEDAISWLRKEAAARR